MCKIVKQGGEAILMVNGHPKRSISLSKFTPEVETRWLKSVAEILKKAS